MKVRDKILCEIYRSRKTAEEMYLYVDKTKGLAVVPKLLIDKIDTAKTVMTLMLTPEKKLARADVIKVLAELEDKGFYLQLPPSPYADLSSASDEAG